MTSNKNNLPLQRQQQCINVLPVVLQDPFALSSTTTSALSDENKHARALKILQEAIDVLDFLDDDDGGGGDINIDDSTT
jgi:hypothetical protein